MNRIQKTVLFALALCGAVRAELVTYPEYDSRIERDYAYAVRVTQGEVSKPLVVYNHCEKSALANRTRGGDVNRRFCEFAFEGEPVRVDIAVTEDVKNYTVFPARRKLKSEFKNGVISVWLDKPVYFGIRLNDYDKTILSVFADKPEDPKAIPAKDKPGCLFVDKWLDATGKDGLLKLGTDITEVYIAPGAVLNARLVLSAPKAHVHGRGMVLDPMSDIFRYDQTQNTSRGLMVIKGADTVVEGIKLIDARTFNLISWNIGITYRDVKVLATMMCSDGFTNGSRKLLVENAWVYVGDNALVVSGVTDATYRDVVLGTSCAAIFPQGTNKKVVMEDVDVFRADDGLVNNWHNGALRRNNKWNEMNGGMQKKEPDPQDYAPQANEFLFRNLSAVDCVLFSKFFSGRNMGALEKTFVFEGLALPAATGSSDWRKIGKTDGVAVEVRNDPKRWLISSNYVLSVSGLAYGGQAVSAFPEKAVRGEKEGLLKIVYPDDKAVENDLPLVADRHEVNWECPWKVFVGSELQRDWRVANRTRKPDRKEAKDEGNLLADRSDTRSNWQRVPSWMVKLEATGIEKGSRLYRLVQCEKGAGLQANLTGAYQRQGKGTYKLAYTLKATSENPVSLRIYFQSNERRIEKTVEIPCDSQWHTYGQDFELNFNPEETDLVALFFVTTATADELVFKDFSLTK